MIKRPFFFAKRSESQMNRDSKGIEARLKSASLSDNGLLSISVILVNFNKDKIGAFDVCLVIKERRSKKVLFKSDFLNDSPYSIRINLSELPRSVEYYYNDIYISYTSLGEETLLRVKNRSVLNTIRIQYMKTRNIFISENNDFITPYITKNCGVSILMKPYDIYDSKQYIRNEIIAYLLFFLGGWVLKQKKIWLIHEKYSSTAQDNSFSFFEFLQQNREQQSYFVIKRTSDDYKYLEKYKKNVVEFMSVKHLLMLLSCQCIVSSESKGHGYVWRTTKGLIRPVLNRKPYVFLQHGVLGLKRLDKTFYAGGINDAKLFISSSLIEKEIITSNFGYDDKRVAITGLSRWDKATERTTSSVKNILFFPTWRTWLEDSSELDFIKSEYFLSIHSLLSNNELKSILEENDIVLNFYIHPKFFRYLYLFETETHFINYVSFSQQTISNLIKKADIVITDYSSVYWDSIYERKFVFLYQFDIEEYLEKQGMYLNREQIKTSIFTKESDLISAINAICTKDQAVVEEVHKIDYMRKNFFKYVDCSNNKRIYTHIRAINFHRTFLDKLKDILRTNPFWRDIYWRVRHLLL